MRIVFFSNFINHHQFPVAKELYRLTDCSYRFVELEPMPIKFKSGGYPDFSNEPFVVKAWESDENKKIAIDLCINADVALFDGHEPLYYELLRCKYNPKGLSFEVSERWFKRGFLNVFSPRFLRWYYAYLLKIRKCNTYKLCCSAFVPNDMKKIMAFSNKCFKWGYITDVRNFHQKYNHEKIKIMWCARFLTLKHPELALGLASRLKDMGYEFIMNIYGGEGNCANGEKVFYRSEMEKIINSKGLNNFVYLAGSISNSQVLDAMAEHDIFLFTSDKREGWGAVANESLSQGCVLIASDAIGSTPYLINDGYNGFRFKNLNLDSLTEKVKYLFDNPDKLKVMQVNAVTSMQKLWNPKHAAESLLRLISDIESNHESSINDGPCSKAVPII